jgi:hypothetical protein
MPEVIGEAQWMTYWTPLAASMYRAFYENVWSSDEGDVDVTISLIST